MKNQEPQQPKKTRNKRYKKKLENKLHTHEALKHLDKQTQETKQRVTNNLNLEAYRLPKENALKIAEDILQANGLSFVLNQVQEQTKARLGHSCIYCFDGMHEA